MVVLRTICGCIPRGRVSVRARQLNDESRAPLATLRTDGELEKALLSHGGHNLAPVPARMSVRI